MLHQLVLLDLVSRQVAFSLVANPEILGRIICYAQADPAEFVVFYFESVTFECVQIGRVTLSLASV